MHVQDLRFWFEDEKLQTGQVVSEKTKVMVVHQGRKARSNFPQNFYSPEQIMGTFDLLTLFENKVYQQTIHRERAESKVHKILRFNKYYPCSP